MATKKRFQHKIQRTSVAKKHDNSMPKLYDLPHRIQINLLIYIYKMNERIYKMAVIANPLRHS
ncbi:hypothetical protein DYI81_10630 [Acinetobacter sp. SWAC5]|nr:hypothetical protein DYI81_10630 [Acinetobacter sp. SWAC5]